MELFTIQCTTCRARLKVNDPSVIGDILACPKCGGMVQVTPPADWQQPAAPVAEVTATAAPKANPERSAAKKAAAVPPVLPQPVAKRAAPLSASSSMSGLPPLPASAPKGVPAVSNPAAASTIVTPAAATAMVTGDSQAVAPALVARLPRDWKLLALGLAGGVALGVAAWLTIVLLTREPDTAVAVAPGASVAEPMAPQPTPEDDTQIPRSSSGERASKARDVEETVVATDEDTRTPTDPATADTAAPQSKLSPATDAAQGPASERATNQPEGKTPAAAIKLEPAAQEPFGPQEPAVASTETDAEPAPLAERPVAVSPEKAPAVADDSSGALPARALSSDEIDERLSGPLPKVRFVKVPLAQFVDFISDFSGLVIVIDDRALAKVSKNRQTPVTVKLADTTARDALRSAVNSLGLTCVVRDGQLVITAVQK